MNQPQDKSLAAANTPGDVTLDQIRQIENTAKICIQEAKNGHIPYLIILIDECLRLIQKTRPESPLHAKFAKLAYWFETTTLTNSADLVCAQCEAEELLQLILDRRAELAGWQS